MGKFLKFFFEYLKINKDKSILCIDPDKNNSKSNKSFLKKIGVKNINSYVAPHYNQNKLKDKKLIKLINKIKPNYILTNIGGGTQEILGLYLKKNINDIKKVILVVDDTSYTLDKRNRFINFFNRSRKVWNEIN